MKYFTKDWCFGNLDDQEYEKIEKNYQKYIKNIYGDLPATLKILVKCINLHDGRIKKVTVFKKENIFKLIGIFGDLEFGYFGLDLKYSAVKAFDVDFLKGIFERKKLEILSNEIECLGKNTYSHKMIFDNAKEFEVIFKRLELKIIDEFSKNYERIDCKLEIS